MACYVVVWTYTGGVLEGERAVSFLCGTFGGGYRLKLSVCIYNSCRMRCSKYRVKAEDMP